MTKNGALGPKNGSRCPKTYVFVPKTPYSENSVYVYGIFGTHFFYILYRVKIDLIFAFRLKF